MMVGVDQPRQDDMVARLKEGGRRRRLAAPRHQFDDPAVLDDDATLRPVGENGQGVFDPDRPHWVHNVIISRRSELHMPCHAVPAILILAIQRPAPIYGGVGVGLARLHNGRSISLKALAYSWI